MKYCIITLLALLISCEKEISKDKEINTYMVDIVFNGTRSDTRQIKLNGEWQGENFNASTGDEISIKAYNICSWTTSGNNMNCQRGDIYIYLNNQKVAEKGCSCQEINLSYIIK
jgi:hypothetical protein